MTNKSDMEYNKKHSCNICLHNFRYKKNLISHMKKHGTLNSNLHICPLCFQTYGKSDILINHIKNYHTKSNKFIKRVSKLKIFYSLPLVNDILTIIDLKQFLMAKILIILDNNLKKYNNIKINFRLNVLFITEHLENSSLKSHLAPFLTKNVNFLKFTNNSNIQKIEQMFIELDGRLKQFTENGSGWTIENFLSFDIEIAKSSNLKGGCYTDFLISNLKHRHCLRIIKNIDNKCLLYSIAAQLGEFTRKQYKNLSQPEIYKNLINTFNIKNMEFPAGITDIETFVNQNNINIEINLLHRSKKGVITTQGCFKCPNFDLQKNPKIVNILLVQNGKNIHYFPIMNSDRYLHLSDHLYKSNKCTFRLYCYKCLYSLPKTYSNKHKMKKHINDCKSHTQNISTPKICLPSEFDKILKFKNISKRTIDIFTIYIDFETINEYSSVCCNCKKNKKICQCSFEIMSHLLPVMYSLMCIKTEDDCSKSIFYQKTFVGTDCANNLLKTLKNLEPKLISYQEKIYTNKVISSSQKKYFLEKYPPDECMTCYLCLQKFNKYEIKVIDHCHRTGYGIGYAHIGCNAQRCSIQTIFPVIAHNMIKFDGKLILQTLTKDI